LSEEGGGDKRKVKRATDARSETGSSERIKGRSEEITPLPQKRGERKRNLAEKKENETSIGMRYCIGAGGREKGEKNQKGG